MPLDPDVRSLLDAIAEAGDPPIATLPPPQARAAFTEWLRGLPPGSETIAGSTDLMVAGKDHAIPVRVYRPPGDAPFPVILFLHGGGWVIGDIEGYDQVCRTLCARTSSIVVSLDYRLAPEHKFPAATDDCLAVARWVGAEIAHHGGDPARLALAGDSAGGNLVAVTAQRLRDEGGPRLKGQLLVYPVADHYDSGHASMAENADGFLLTRGDMVTFWDAYLRGPADKQDPAAAPLQAKHFGNLPPALVLTAEFDPLRDEGEAYARAMEKAGVPVRLSRHPGTIHGAFMLFPILRSGSAMMDEGCAWLKERLAS